MHKIQAIVDEGGIFALDHVYNSWAGPALVWFTNLGYTRFLFCLTVLAAIWFAKMRRIRAAAVLLVLFAMSVCISHLGKIAVKRPRPNEPRTPIELLPQSYSFPSGHALCSAAVYLGIALLLQQMPVRRSIRLTVLITCSLLVVLIGFSRMVLGVHYLTDVLAGWLLGCALAFLGSEFVAKKERKLQQSPTSD